LASRQSNLRHQELPRKARRAPENLKTTRRKRRDNEKHGRDPVRPNPGSHPSRSAIAFSVSEVFSGWFFAALNGGCLLVAMFRQSARGETPVKFVIASSKRPENVFGSARRFPTPFLDVEESVEIGVVIRVVALSRQE
jgi:hypothetical protein